MWKVLMISVVMLSITTGQDNKIRVHKELGVVMTKVGKLVSNVPNILTSIFLHIPAPIMDTNACHRGCGLNQDVINMIYKEHKNCIQKGVAPVGAVTTFTLEVKSVLEGEKGEVQCLGRCLKTKGCAQWGVTNKYCTLRNMSFDYVPGQSNSVEMNMNCMLETNESLDQFCEEKATPINQLFKLKNEEYVQRIWNRTQVINKGTSEHFRSKRGVIDSTATMGGLALGGYSLYQQWKLKSHVKGMEEKYKHFAESVQDLEKTEVKFNEGVVKIVAQVQDDFQLAFKDLQTEQSCVHSALAHEIMQHENLVQWGEVIMDITKMPEVGAGYE